MEIFNSYVLNAIFVLNNSNCYNSDIDSLTCNDVLSFDSEHFYIGKNFLEIISDDILTRFECFGTFLKNGNCFTLENDFYNGQIQTKPSNFKINNILEAMLIIFYDNEMNFKFFLLNADAEKDYDVDKIIESFKKIFMLNDLKKHEKIGDEIEIFYKKFLKFLQENYKNPSNINYFLKKFDEYKVYFLESIETELFAETFKNYSNIEKLQIISEQLHYFVDFTKTIGDILKNVVKDDNFNKSMDNYIKAIISEIYENLEKMNIVLNENNGMLMN